jgi:ferric-dicitrate binding protein FerR (iron transport regulator)
MTPSEFDLLLQKYLAGDCTREEQDFIVKWYEAIGKENRNHLGEGGRVMQEASLWSGIQSMVRQNLELTRNPERSKKPWRLRLAASVIIVLGVCFYLMSPGLIQRDRVQQMSKVQVDENPVIHEVNNGKSPRRVILDDGSKITLHPASEITFRKKLSTDQREVHLEGRAFFEVVKDANRPFLVYTKAIVTRVLGTSFTIKAYKDEREITVAVNTGKVSVYTQSKTNPANNRKVVLTPNQQAVYNCDREQVSRELVEDPQIILPVPTLFNMKYDGTPVVKIFQVLEENYGIDIVYEEAKLSGCTLTTSMTVEGLYDRIRIICEAIGAQYEIRDTQIIIRSSGCNEK